MKAFNKLKIVFSLLIILLAGFKAYELISDSHSYICVIPKSASSVLRVSLYDLKKTLFLDACSSPVYYYQHLQKVEKSNDKKESSGEKENGFNDNPTNVFLFTIDDQPYHWYTYLEIKNHTDFEAFLKREILGKEEVIQASSDYHFTYVKNQFSIAWNKKRAIISYSLIPQHKLTDQALFSTCLLYTSPSPRDA